MVSLQLSGRMVASDLDRAIALAEAGAVDLTALITHRYPLDQVADAFAMLDSRDGLKVVVNPTLEGSTES